jgi:hypothetical protein
VGGDAAAVLLAIANGQLVVARGPRAELRAGAAALLGAAASPIDEAALRGLARGRGATVRGIGWIDPQRVAAVAARSRGVIPELDELSPRCRQSALELLASLPRISLDWAEPSPARIALTASVELSPATAAALGAASRAAPSLPPKLAGRPLVAASVIAVPAPLGAPWKAHIDGAARACAAEGGTPTATSLPAPWNTLEAGALVLYGGRWQGFLPGELDGFAGVLAPQPGVILAALGRAAPSLARDPPKDGGGLVPLRVPELAQLVPDLGIARRGNLLLAAGGAVGKAHVGELTVRDAAPLLRLLVDISAIRARFARPAAQRATDDEYFTASSDEDGSWSSPLSSLVGAIELIAELAPAPAAGARLQLAIDVAQPPPGPASGSIDPRRALRDQCRALLRKSFAATAPALAKLGVTTELDGIARTYTTSVEASGAVHDCAKLSDAKRACILNALDPLAAAPRCAPSKDGFRPSELELPPLFSFFGPSPLEARFHPAIDGRALRASLVGRWVRKGPFGTETWQIDGAGNLTIRSELKGETPTTKRYRLEENVAGEL